MQFRFLGAIDYVVNKDLVGLTPLEVYDRVIEELGKAQVAVIINNHTTLGAWSGGVEPNGMWYRLWDPRVLGGMDAFKVHVYNDILYKMQCML